MLSFSYIPKSDVSRHKLIWTLSPVSVCGTRAQSLPAPLGHTLYGSRHIPNALWLSDRSGPVRQLLTAAQFRLITSCYCSVFVYARA